MAFPDRPVSSAVRRARFARGLVAALASAAPAASGAEPKQVKTCVDAHYEAQRLRDGGKLVDARKRLVTCSQEGCPRAVSRECSEWLADIDKVVPSIVLRAVDARGRDVLGVNVTENGERLELSPDGKALPVDPGLHTFHFEHDGQVVDEQVLMHEGEQRRTLVITFDRSNAPPPATPPVARPPGGGAPGGGAPGGAGRGRHLTPAAIALGGVGLVALGSFAYFGLAGRNDYERLRDACGRGCAPADVREARTKLIVADSSLGVALVATSVATLLFFTSASPPKADGARGEGRLALPALAPTAGGLVTSVAGSF
jgi:hypothetical protein